MRHIWEQREKSIIPKKKTKARVRVPTKTMGEPDTGGGGIGFCSDEEMEEVEEAEVVGANAQLGWFRGQEEDNSAASGGLLPSYDAEEWDGMEEQRQASIASDLECKIRIGHILTTAAPYGLIEQWGIACDGNCLFDAVNDQVRIRLKSARFTHMELRQECVKLIMKKYGHTSPTVLIDAGRETSWADWENKMCHEFYYGDELCVEAIEEIFDARIFVVGSNGVGGYPWDATLLKNRKNVIWLGCSSDHHFMSLVEPRYCLSAEFRDEQWAKYVKVRLDICASHKQTHAASPV